MSSVNFLMKTVDANSYIKNLMVDGEADEDSRLHVTAVCGDAHGMQSLLLDWKNLYDVNSKVRPFAATPLRLAVTGGNPACVKMLIKAGASVDLEDIKGQTPLFVATSLKNYDIMKILLKAGASPSGSPLNRSTPLLIAVRDGFIQGVKLLLEFKATTEPPEYLINLGGSGWALHHSVVYSHFHCFLALLSHGAVPNLESVYTLKPFIQTRLSIPHAIVKYVRDKPEFARLYCQSGGNLRQLGTTGQTVIKENNEPSRSFEEIKQLMETPLTLKAVCRLKIRTVIGKSRLRLITSLDLPTVLLCYLQYGEYNYIASTTDTNEHIKLLPEQGS